MKTLALAFALLIPFIMALRCSPPGTECYRITFNDNAGQKFDAYRVLRADEVETLIDIGWQVTPQPEQHCSD